MSYQGTMVFFNLQNKHYAIGILTMNIGVALLLAGCFSANIIALGISAGFLVFGTICFIIGSCKEEQRQSLPGYNGI